MSEENINEIEITLNGEKVFANPGELLIDAAERMGTEIPRFCHHSRLKPVGMCRMCLVEVDTGRGPSLQPSCMLTCQPGMTVETESESTVKAQDGVLEFLLINHPLDCAICDKGGECPLQDQTLAYGPGESRYTEQKRNFEKPIPINENVYLDRERCILCDRCTRFADEVAGDKLIHFQGRGSLTQVNTFPEEPFSSYFSGNTVQICPVGALTARPYRFKARPWDLEEAESTSVFDSVGSRISVHASRNKVLRLQGVDSDNVNWGWLSDKERFMFEAFSHTDRLDTPLMKKNEDENSKQEEASWPESLEAAAAALMKTSSNRIAVLGGSRLTNESQYAWTKIAKGILGTDHIDAQMGDGLSPEILLGLPRATINDACLPGGTIVLLGPDLKEELGSLYLRIRHAVVHDGATLIELTPTSTGLTPYATHSLRVRPGETAEVVQAMFGEGGLAPIGGVDSETAKSAGSLLQAANNVTVLLGRSSLAEAEGPVIDAALALHDRLADVQFLSLLRRGNIHGAFDMGMAPNLLPGRTTLTTNQSSIHEVWPTLPTTKGQDAVQIIESAAEGNIDVLVLLGADPLSDFPDKDLAYKAIDRTETIISVDLFPTDTTCKANIVFPAAGPTEIDGTFTNLEGRISLVSRKVSPPGTARPDWMIAVDLAKYLGIGLGFSSVEEIWEEIEKVSPIHENIIHSLSEHSREGILVQGGLDLLRPQETQVQSHDAYAFRLVVTRTLYDQGTFNTYSQSLTGLTPNASLGFEPTDFAALGVEVGEEVEVVGPKGSVALPAKPDSKVAKGTVHVGLNHAGFSATELIDASVPVTDLTVVSK